MKTQFVLLALLIATAAFSQQNKKEEKKERSRIASCKLKTATQTSYEYVWDIKTNKFIPSTKGLIVEKSTYDQKGNIIEDILYNQVGNIDSKTTSKYDSKGNQIESAVYGSDGMMQSKIVVEYKIADTLKGFKFYDGSGNLTGTNFVDYEITTTPEGNKVQNLVTFFGKDTTLAGSEKSTFDSKGNLIAYAKYKGQYQSLSFRGEYSYNEKGWKIKYTEYNQNGDFYGMQKFKYDEKGYLIERDSYGDSFGYVLATQDVAKNDTKGNIITIIYYDGKGNAKSFDKYTYTYYQ